MKEKQTNSFRVLVAFCILYALYFYAAMLVGIFRWIHHH